MKAYVKPELFYESFELSQHIAYCAYDMNHTDKNSCAAIGDGNNKDGQIFHVAGINLFTDVNGACNIKWDGVTSELYCYTNGALGWNVFNS